MVKIIITENQLKKITKETLNEAVGVPENVIEYGEELYEIISNLLKTIQIKKGNYNFSEPIDFTILDMTFSLLNFKVKVVELEDYDYGVEIASMGVSNEFQFNDQILMQINQKSHEIDLVINFVVPENWKPKDLYNSFTSNPNYSKSLLTHELKHKIDRQKKKATLLGDTADYQSYSSQQLNFGIPVINEFMRYSYFIQASENLVRPSEVAARMVKKGVTKDEFYNFIINDDVYKELKKINNFSFEYLISRLKDEMEDIDELIEHTEVDPTKMSEKEKINYVFELVYVNLANLKIDIFDKYLYNAKEKLDNMFNSIFPGMAPKSNVDKEKIRKKFVNYIIKYKDREIEFFKNECERFNYESRKLMKKISKIYALIPDEKKETNESITNWDLNQKVVEKKYGIRPIQKEYKVSK